MTTHESRRARRRARVLLNKVPEVTVFFWIIKILATTVGETAADFLTTTSAWAWRGTTLVMTAVFVVVLVVQFRTRRYVPAIYWLTVVLISVVGTLLTDNLTDALGVPLVLSTDRVRGRPRPSRSPSGTRSRADAVDPQRRHRAPRGFYWLAILFTFALGTAAGDLVDEKFGVGYWPTALIVALLIGAIAVSHLVFRAERRA